MESSSFVPQLKEDLCHYFITVDASNVKFVGEDCSVETVKIHSKEISNIILADGKNEKLYFED